MEKVIKNGEVAVCYSPGYGAGWSTWGDNNQAETLIFHPKIVKMVLDNRQSEITPEWLVENFGEEYEDVYCGGADSLEIEWIKEGQLFRIDEYDGYESILIINNQTCFTA